MPKFRFTGGFLTGGLFPKPASNGDSGSAPDTSSLPDTDTLAGGPPRERDPRPMLPRFHDARMPPTSLHEAAYLGDADSVQTFLEDGYGVDSLASPGDVTPLHLATMQVRCAGSSGGMVYFPCIPSITWLCARCCGASRRCR